MQSICNSVHSATGLEISKQEARQIMKKKMNLSFVKAKKLLSQANSMKVRIQRQQYALVLLRLLEQGNRIINIDETWLNETCFIRKVWAKKGNDSNVSLKSINPRISMIAALDNMG